ALSSHEKALQAMEAGRLGEEIVPIEVKDGKQTVIVDRDQHPRVTSMEKLAKLEPKFKADGVVTAGNASGINDGAGAGVVTSADAAAHRGLTATHRRLTWVVAGTDRKIMGIGPCPAIQHALKKANLSLKAIALLEI